MFSLFSGQLWQDSEPAPFLSSLEIFPDENHLLYIRESKCFRAILNIINCLNISIAER